MKLLLVGTAPDRDLGHTYVTQPPYEGVMIGSLTLGQAAAFSENAVLAALAEGKAVFLYTPGLPQSPKNRALAGSLNARYRELKSWGVLFVDGAQRTLITAQAARAMRQKGERPGPGAVLTPLAKEILEGKV